jgi:hypothetical protein
MIHSFFNKGKVMIDHLVSILSAVIVALLTAFVIGWKKRVDVKFDLTNTALKQAERNTIEVADEIRKNYVNQFTQVRQAINDTHLDSVKEIRDLESRLKDCLNTHFVSDKMCETRHEEIKEILFRKEN